MSETKQFDNHGSGGISGELIRRFLLGGLPADEQTAFEEQLIVDDALGQEVRLAELELADDYAFQRLATEEQNLYETNFLVSADRRRELIVSKTLRDFYAPAIESKKKATLEVGATISERVARLFDSFGFKRPAVRLAFGFAALVLFAGITWLVISGRRNNQPVIVKHAPVPEATSAGNSPTPSASVSPEPTPKRMITPDTARPALVASFLLLPNALRDGGQMTRIVLPKGERDVVRLQLSLEASEPATNYAAELLTAEGQHVSNSRHLKVGDKAAVAKVNFDVPAPLLKVGDYQVRLSRVTSGTTEAVARYYFRITQ